MKYLLASLLLLALPCTATAQSVLLGRTLVGKGDSAALVRTAGGEPAQIDVIPGDETTPDMEIWTYRPDGKVITLWLVGGKIVNAEESKSAALAGAAAGGNPR